MHYLHHYFSIFYFYHHITMKKLGDFVMKLKFLLQILEQEDSDLDVLFNVKDVECIEDFAHLSDVYSDGEAVIIEFR